MKEETKKILDEILEILNESKYELEKIEEEKIEKNIEKIKDSMDEIIEEIEGLLKI